ncbi:DUF5119 domain-containing protein [Bacteroides sp. GM023]|uniref:DUF5119 domain-containing protein n=1 Tax=Bacteroides sp. GM023 TaxID=2723058 RepID=UPI00351C7562
MILSVWCAVLLLAACDVKDPIFNTSHPDYGIVTLTAQWSGIGEGLAVPESYTIKAGNYTATLTGVTNKLDYLFEPGDYRFYVYNTPERITMNNTVASVIAPAVIPTDAGSTTSDNPERFVYDAPGWLFTSVLDATLTADTEHILAAPMQQQVRQLTLIIEPTGGMADKIESITATLSGVAGTLDIANGTHGAPSRVALTFSKILFGTDAGKWSATVRLLGIAGTQQRLTGTVTFASDILEPLILDNDLTTQLAAFNADKCKPFTLGGSVVETLTEVGFGTTITNWTPVNRGSITAD